VSALKGSLTYARLFVEGDLPKDFRDRFTKAIRLRAMKPLEPDEEVLERNGWCAVGEPFELDPAYEDVFYNEYLNLGFRTDKWAIPGALLRAKLREAEAAQLAKKGRERLTREEKAELKEFVVKRIKKQLAPVTRVVDLSWSLNEGVVRFFSQSERAAVAMSDLFHRTFGLKLVPEAPYTLAARLGLGKAEESAWQELEAINLVTEQDS
jgi:recombination associated protein RdgC